MSTALPPAPSVGGTRSDALLDRLGRVALAACLLLAAAGWWLMGPSFALGVLGGGLLSRVSLWAVGSAVGAFLTPATTATPGPEPETRPETGPETGGLKRSPGTSPETSPETGPETTDPERTGPAPIPATTPVPPRATVRGALIRVVTGHALLALLAYAMIARLRLHPMGLLLGASSVVVAASAEALRVVARRGAP